MATTSFRSNRGIVLWVARVLALTCATGFTASLQAQEPAENTASRPFSNGLEFADTVYVSGHLGVDPATRKPPADPAVEAKLVLDAVAATLRKSGLQMDDLVSVEIYCTDLTLFATFNKEYTTRVHTPYPARAFLGAKDLLFGAHFEVLGVARRGAATAKRAAK